MAAAVAAVAAAVAVAAPVALTSLTSQERRALYASSDPRVKFVQSYSLAVAGCMKQSQLVARDPQLMGKLLQYFVASFLRKYWRLVLSVLGALLAVVLSGQGWVLMYTPWFVVVGLACKVWLVRASMTTELLPNVPLRSFHFFKHPRLLARAKQGAVARMYGSSASAGINGAGLSSSFGGGGTTPSTPGTPGGPSVGLVGSGGSSTLAPATMVGNSDILFQPSEGYCGQAALNNLLASLSLHPPHLAAAAAVTAAAAALSSSSTAATTTAFTPLLKSRFFVVLPALVRPFALREMEAYVNQLVLASAAGVLADSIEKVECIYGWEGEGGGNTTTNNNDDNTPAQGYAAFLHMVSSQVNDPKHRFLANFLRTPLFFCEEDKRVVAAANAAAAASASASGAGFLSPGAPSFFPSTPSPAPSASSSSQSSRSHPHHPHPQPHPPHPQVPPVSLGRKLFSGHWSPLIGFLAAGEAEQVLGLSAGGGGSRTGSATPQTGPANACAHAYAYPPSPAIPGAKIPGAGSGPIGRGISVGGASPLRNTARLGALAERGGGSGGGSGAAGVGAGAGAGAVTSTPLFMPGSAISEACSSPSGSGSGGGSGAESSSAAALPGLALGPAAVPVCDHSPLAAIATVSLSPPHIRPTMASHAVAHDATGLAAASISSASASASSSAPYFPSSSSIPAPSPWGVPSFSSSLPFHPTERHAMREGLCLIADVNPSYGHFLVPPRRLYDAVRTSNLMDGGPRGVLRITLKTTPSDNATQIASHRRTISGGTQQATA